MALETVEHAGEKDFEKKLAEEKLRRIVNYLLICSLKYGRGQLKILPAPRPILGYRFKVFFNSIKIKFKDMSPLIKAINRLEYANFLIKKKATGNLETFAGKMKLSKSALRTILSQMRELNASIEYDRLRKTYYYSKEGEFCISKFMNYGQVLTREDAGITGKPEELCFWAILKTYQKCE